MPTSTHPFAVNTTSLSSGYYTMLMQGANSDGVVRTDLQTHPELGRVLGGKPLEGIGHFDTVLSFTPFISHVTPSYATAIARATITRILNINLLKQAQAQ